MVNRRMVINTSAAGIGDHSQRVKLTLWVVGLKTRDLDKFSCGLGQFSCRSVGWI
jgi:hypothetical protein